MALSLTVQLHFLGVRLNKHTLKCFFLLSELRERMPCVLSKMVIYHLTLIHIYLISPKQTIFSPWRCFKEDLRTFSEISISSKSNETDSVFGNEMRPSR